MIERFQLATGGDPVSDAAPMPPRRLVRRVGHPDASLAAYEAHGRAIRDDLIVRLLPAGWSFAGKRTLDFGCGAGRVLRHFLDEARHGEFIGCDIDAESIDWASRQLSPPLSFFHCSEEPPLPFPSESFDLICAFSVFTHLAETWSAWLLEMQRLLTSDGIFIATFCGSGLSEMIAGEPWDDQRIGMNVLRHGASWDLGGPLILHSPWWIREHWGRAFEIDTLWASGFASPEDREQEQGVVAARRKPLAPTREDLERIDPTQGREILALRHNIAQLHRESKLFRDHADGLQVEQLQRTLEGYQGSLSWRLTRPLRSLRGVARRLPSR